MHIKLLFLVTDEIITERVDKEGLWKNFFLSSSFNDIEMNVFLILAKINKLQTFPHFLFSSKVAIDACRVGTTERGESRKKQRYF